MRSNLTQWTVHMDRRSTTTGLISVLMLAFSACEKVVTIDLNKADPRTVIEGVVTDQPGPDSVFVSKSGDYFEPTLYFPPIPGAFVSISDDLGNSDTLQEVKEGTYVGSRIQGAPGRMYTLKVVAEGKEYDAVSSMPTKVRIDSLYATPLREFDGDRGYNLYVVFRDPPEPGNYYRINLRVNKPLPPDSITGQRYRLFSDKLTNGNQVTLRLRTGRSVITGDTVQVDLLSIDKASYEYFRTLNNILTSDRAPTSLAPANPNTNLSNGSLGYFSAYTIHSKTIVLK